MKKLVILLVIVCLIFVAGNINASEPEIIFDDPELSLFLATDYDLQAEIPDNISKVWVNGREAEVYKKFRVKVPLREAPSYTSAIISVKNETGEIIENFTLQIANKHELIFKLWIDQIHIEENGRKNTLAVPPTVINGRTMVPFRVLAEAVGAEVSWIAATRTLVMELNDTRVELTIDNDVAMIDGKEVIIKPPATIINGSTIVPFRFVAEAFEAEVHWNGDDRSIIIKKEITPIPDFKTPKVKSDGNLILDEYEPSVLEEEYYVVEGEVPTGSSVFVNDLEAEVFKKFRVNIPIKEEPSFTSVFVEMIDSDGNEINLRTTKIENVGELFIKLWIGQPIMQVDDDEVTLDVPAEIIMGRTMVPIRAIADGFGATTDWISASKTVRVKLDDTEILLPVGEKEAWYNNVPVELDVPAEIVNGRTMVPFRFVAEAFESEVDWIGEERAIEIRKKIYP